MFSESTRERDSSKHETRKRLKPSTSLGVLVLPTLMNPICHDLGIRRQPLIVAFGNLPSGGIGLPSLAT